MTDGASFQVDAGPEATLVELPTLRKLCGDIGEAGLGWTYVHGPELAPDAPAGERKLWSDVVLVERLRRAIARLNPDLPPQAVTRAAEIVLTSSSPVVIETHRALHDLLLAGVPVAYRDIEGMERNTHARVVDFDDVSRNEFLAVNQLTVIVGGNNRRPDILLYVNGLPLGEIEVKAPGLEDPAEQAVNQIAHYTRAIPSLYRYVEIVGVTDLLKAVVGTVTTPAEHFAEWKTMSEDDRERSRPQLELMLDGVFEPARFLELIRDFMLFETDGARVGMAWD
jgi:type I restriction enzyme R subunit